MAQSFEHHEFDLAPGDKVLIGDLIVTVHDIDSEDAKLLVERVSEEVELSCDSDGPLARINLNQAES
ncbi:MAG: hypothetical protein ACYTGL_05945 [Planctomycetota bacterium]